ncbi:MAG TPA: non-homologous end-joining DNA ligase [Actinomycetota bacterium]|nr:non-homologous end-joining DNA ligase [Actinomycetota bacterium]
MAPRFPPVFTPMLATLGEEPFDSKEHLFEIKWDGVRTLCFCDSDETRLYSRTGREVTHQYPEFKDLHKKLKVTDAIFDGEIVAMDSNLKPSFELLQQRINLSGTSIARGVANVPLDLVLFDVLFVDGDWLGGRSLVERASTLPDAVELEDRVVISEAIAEHGLALFEAARQRGLEGIVAKRSNSIYVPGRRTRDWIKLKVVQRIDCVIGGWSPGRGSRSSSLGALLLGLNDGTDLRFIGSVGTGFTEKTLGAVREALAPLEVSHSPFGEKVPVKDAHWVTPDLVCEVEFREATSQMRLRAPSFKGLRTDKHPRECTVEQIHREPT